MCTAGDRTEGLGGLEAGARAAPLSTSQHAEQAAGTSVRPQLLTAKLVSQLGANGMVRHTTSVLTEKPLGSLTKQASWHVLQQIEERKTTKFTKKKKKIASRGEKKK